MIKCNVVYLLQLVTSVSVVHIPSCHEMWVLNNKSKSEGHPEGSGTPWYPTGGSNWTEDGLDLSTKIASHTIKLMVTVFLSFLTERMFRG